MDALSHEPAREGARIGADLRAWWAALRPRTLLVGLAPVVLGSALAARAGVFSWPVAIDCLLVVCCLQIAANLHNDVADFRRGVDGDERLGPERMVATGRLRARAVERAFWFAVALALVPGLWLVAKLGPGALLLGALCIAGLLSYAGGPRPLAYTGGGEALALLFFGPVAVLGTAWSHGLAPNGVSLTTAAALGALAAAVLVTNDLRDRETDARAGKRTLTVRLGARYGRLAYSGYVLFAYGSLISLSALGHGRGLLLPLVLAPLAIRNVLAVWRTDGRALNRLLAASALHAFAFAALSSVGMVLWR